MELDDGCIVHVASSRFEADILMDALRKEGIPCSCRVYEDTAYDGIFVPQKGWGAILVSISNRERAEGIISEALDAYRKR